MLTNQRWGKIKISLEDENQFCKKHIKKIIIIIKVPLGRKRDTCNILKNKQKNLCQRKRKKKFHTCKHPLYLYLLQGFSYSPLPFPIQLSLSSSPHLTSLHHWREIGLQVKGMREREKNLCPLPPIFLIL